MRPVLSSAPPFAPALPLASARPLAFPLSPSEPPESVPNGTVSAATVASVHGERLRPLFHLPAVPYAAASWPDATPAPATAVPPRQGAECAEEGRPLR